MLDLRPDLARRPEIPAAATVGGLAFTTAYAPGAVAARADRAERACALAAADEERRRVVRDLHDGAQQRLVHTMLVLELALQALDHDADEARALIRAALEQSHATNAELRELARGVVPLTLREGGVEAGVRALAEQAPVRVDVDVAVPRLPPAVEATAYFVVAEALTNVAKHARARTARVTVALDGRLLRVEIRDDGVGGADPAGCGLRGLAERVAALGGDFDVAAPYGVGTRIRAAMPVLG